MTTRPDSDDPAQPPRIDTDPRPWSQVQDEQQPLPIAPRAATKAQPHSALKKRCRDALAKWSGARGVLIPVQNVKVETGKGAAKKSFMTGRVGCADDIYLIDGRAVGLEYKMKWDEQRETQIVFQRRWEAAGGVYLIVRSPEQMIAGIEAALKARAS